MAASNRSTLNGDFHFNGTLTANNMTIPANSVTDASLTAPAPGGTFIDKDKLEHQINILFSKSTGLRRPMNGGSFTWRTVRGCWNESK